MAKKKTPQEASDTFESIIKASVKDNKTSKPMNISDFATHIAECGYALKEEYEKEHYDVVKKFFTKDLDNGDEAVFELSINGKVYSSNMIPNSIQFAIFKERYVIPNTIQKLQTLEEAVDCAKRNR